MFSRRALLALPLLATAAQAQTFPAGQVRIIVPFPPGGATDVLGRVLALDLQTVWGQTVISEYRPGAAGVIGTRQVMAAPPDGATLLMASTGAILSLASSAPTPFDIVRELSPISLIAAPPYILVVNPNVPARRTAEVIAHAKANPGKLSFGSSGAVGSLSGALFAQMTRHRHAACALSRHRACGDRSARRTHRCDVLTCAGGDAAYRGGHAACDRRDGRRPLRTVSGFPDHRRDRTSRLSVARLVRVVRTRRDAARNHREDQRRCPRGAHHEGGAGAPRRTGRGAGAEHPGGLHGVHQCGYREVA